MSGVCNEVRLNDGLGPGWTLIFAAGCSVQMFRTLGDPQRGAIEVRRDHPWLDEYYFIAAVEGTARVLPADTARTAECGLEGWPA